MVGEALRAADPLPLVLTLCLFIPIYMLKAWRWHRLIGAAGVRQTYERSFHTYSAALFLGVVTPGNIGETIKIAYLTKAGVPLAKASVLMLVDRLYDVVWIGLFATPSLLFLLPEETKILSIVLVSVLLIVLLALVASRRRVTEAALRGFSHLSSPSAHAITLANWAVYYLQLLTLASAFHIGVPLLPFLGIMTVAGVLNLLAVAPAGLGTRDAALLFFFQAYHVPAAQTVAFSFSIFALTLFASLLGCWGWFRAPLSSSR